MNSPFEISQDVDISSDTDSLSLKTTDNLPLLGGTTNNIEFIIEDDDDDEDNVEFISNSTVLHVSNSEQANDQQDITDSGSYTGSEQYGVHDGGDLQKRCYVPNCLSKGSSKDKLFWFSAPYDKNLRKIWDVCIDRSDRRLGQEDLICHRHFLKQDILHELSIPRKDNKELTVSFGKPKLREGAVPCIQFHEECCVPMCNRSFGRMYCFPIAHNSSFRLWLYMIKNPLLKNLEIKELLRHRVCEVHFEADCFADDFVLKRTAAPTLYLPGIHAVDFVDNVKAVPREEANTSQDAYLLCIYNKCNNGSNTDKNIFMFPSDPDRCIDWLKACGREDLITTGIETVQRMKSRVFGVCEDHFDYNSFASTLNKLKPDAIPKHHKASFINFRESKAYSSQSRIPLESPKVLDTEKKSTTLNSSIEKTVNVCFHKNCTFKSLQNDCFFRFPTDKNRYEAWLNACGYSNLAPKTRQKILGSEKICSKHFKPEMFETETKLKEDAMPDEYETSFTMENSQEGIKNQCATARTSKKIWPKSCKMYCAVENCGNIYSSSSSKGMYHKFPDPTTDEERFNVWLSLLANVTLSEYTNEEIYNKYIVCFKHFESFFYENGVKSNPLSQEAIPTKNLTADLQWFFESDYYKSRLQDYFNNSAVEDFSKQTIEWKRDETIKADDQTIHNKTKCILEEDGIRFPGMEHYLYMGQPTKRKNALKKTFPYRVYKRFKTGYGLNNDIEIGENIRIHTAIIIDDDDDCEREVLQQLLDERRKV